MLPFSGLVRNDTFDRPVVIRTGSVFVTAGTDRRSSGTHYTPRSLTEPIVQFTLEPLVYVGPAEGKPKEEWTLRPARELLDLKVCDMACGSGAFLVQACRYLSERLVEAWELVEINHRGTETQSGTHVEKLETSRSTPSEPGEAGSVLCPEGAETNQPRATPWDSDDDHPAKSPEGATQTQAGSEPPSPVPPFQGGFEEVSRFPGRCPGLVCPAPPGQFPVASGEKPPSSQPTRPLRASVSLWLGLTPYGKKPPAHPAKA